MYKHNLSVVYSNFCPFNTIFNLHAYVTHRPNILDQVTWLWQALLSTAIL